MPQTKPQPTRRLPADYTRGHPQTTRRLCRRLCGGSTPRIQNNPKTQLLQLLGPLDLDSLHFAQSLLHTLPPMVLRECTCGMVVQVA